MSKLVVHLTLSVSVKKREEGNKIVPGYNVKRHYIARQNRDRPH